jgi:hypothetical protein
LCCLHLLILGNNFLYGHLSGMVAHVSSSIKGAVLALGCWGADACTAPLHACTCSQLRTGVRLLGRMLGGPLLQHPMF